MRKYCLILAVGLAASLAVALVGCDAAIVDRVPCRSPAAVDWNEFIASDGTRLRCAVEDQIFDVPRNTPVPVVWDNTVPRASWVSLYPPMIRLRSDFLQFTPAAQVFAVLHECGHINTLSTDEALASCWAARRVDRDDLLDPDEWDDVREMLLDEFPAADERYASGADQWARIQECVSR